MIRQRVRIRFRKDGELRFISHRDLARVFERMFRRAGLKLGMSQGFHPKIKMSFPSALALGIAGIAEVMEFELAEECEASDLKDRLCDVAPPGLTVTELKLLDENDKKCRVELFTFEFPVPSDYREQVSTAIDEFTTQTSYLIEREGRKTPVDVRAGTKDVELIGERVRFQLYASSQNNVRPRELLTVLGLNELEKDGYYLSRVDVELST